MSHLVKQFPERFKQLIQDQVVDSGVHDPVKHLVLIRKNFIAFRLRDHAINQVPHLLQIFDFQRLNDVRQKAPFQDVANI